MRILIEMFVRFFECGLFSVGGGLATLPFLYKMSEATGWFTSQDISNMIAISESTPGPLGINMATYVGFQTMGVPGALVASMGLICPSLIVIIAISGFLQRFKNEPLVQHAFYGLRAASAALITMAGLGVAQAALLREDWMAQGFFVSINWKAVILAVFIYIGIRKFKKHPIVYIAVSAVIGIVFQFT